MHCDLSCFTPSLLSIYLGQPGDVTVIGDFDGDGLTDIGAFCEGHWLLRDAATGQISDVQFGQADDIPMEADFDFDFDGKDDLTLRREGTGYVRRSGDQVVERTTWGHLQPGDSVIFGDYDGDGRAEPAVRHAAKGAWEILFRQTPH